MLPARRAGSLPSSCSRHPLTVVRASGSCHQLPGRSCTPSRHALPGAHRIKGRLSSSRPFPQDFGSGGYRRPYSPAVPGAQVFTHPLYRDTIPVTRSKDTGGGLSLPLATTPFRLSNSKSYLGRRIIHFWAKNLFFLSSPPNPGVRAPKRDRIGIDSRLLL